MTMIRFPIIMVCIISSMVLCQVAERIKISDGRYVQLNLNGTYSILEKKTIIKRTHDQLTRWLSGKTIAEVRQMLGVQPWVSETNSTVINEDGTFFYPYGISSKVAKGSYLYYRNFSQILWNPDVERYENFYIHFYQGKFFTIQLGPEDTWIADIK